MNRPTPEEQHALIRQWDETGRMLDEMRLEKLRGLPHDVDAIDDLLRIADQFPQPSRTTSGLIEQQYWFMKVREHMIAKEKER